MKKKTKLFCIIGVTVVCVSALIGEIKAYMDDYYPAREYEIKTELVQEEEDYTIIGDSNSEKGFIFYPGAKVEEAAYVPILDELAEAGICCVLVNMPHYLAILDTDAAGNVMQDLPKIKEWYIGGHSLGGAMASGFAAEHEEKFAGLILLAAYPMDTLEHLPVLSVYGSNDQVLNYEKYEESISSTPNLTEYVIEGGNHAGFGFYGEQEGDGIAEISEEEQWQQTVDYILNFIAE